MAIRESLVAIASRGDEKGIELRPHTYADGTYLVSMTRFEDDPSRRRIGSVRELIRLAGRGYCVRMSNRASVNHRSPSLIRPESLMVRRGGRIYRVMDYPFAS